MTLTKQTVFLFSAPIPSTYDMDAYSAEVVAKINELVAQEKTDGVHSYSYPDTTQVEVRRSWVDQASAEDWVTFVDSLDVKYGRGVINKEIIDLVA